MSYRDFVKDTAETNGMSFEGKLRLGARGLLKELQELFESLHTALLHKRPKDIDGLICQLGDLRWYMEFLTIVLGVPMEEVEQRNIKKLLKRRAEKKK